MSAKLHSIWLSKELKTLHYFCPIFKRNFQLLCLQWKWFHPQLIIHNVAQSAPSPQRVPEVSPTAPTLSLSHRQRSLWPSSEIPPSCVPVSPSVYQHSTCALQTSVLPPLDSTAGSSLSSCLVLPILLFVLFIAAMAIFPMQMWAHHSSPYKLPCLSVAFSLQSELLRLLFKAPQLHSVAPLSSCVFHSSFTIYSLILSHL